MQDKKKGRQEVAEQTDYERTKMQKKLIIQKLKEQGCRMTKQRLVVLDIILEEECTCCKEIYYQVSKKDKCIGKATIYRMINALEDIGAINLKNRYKVACEMLGETEKAYAIELDNHTMIYLSLPKWHQIVQSGLAACGYLDGHEVYRIHKNV